MKIKAELILASHNLVNKKTLCTFKFTFPRIILAEVNTHKVLAKNTASSRAIPSKKLRRLIKDDPFIPRYIGAYQSGMQAGQELDGWRRRACELIYGGLRYPNLLGNYLLEKLGAHKQVQNRLIEPWMWVEQIVSGTEWQNFINLRANEKAEPHFQELAYQVKDIIADLQQAINYSKYWHKYKNHNLIITSDPKYIHVPFVTEDEISKLPNNVLLNISAARCARVSYYLPDSTKLSSIEKDMELIKKLTGENPKHLSPFEHQGLFTTSNEWSGNFKGWVQYRKTFKDEEGLIPC